jgi:thiol-disulfide isomerase/thioredoxin
MRRGALLAALLPALAGCAVVQGPGPGSAAAFRLEKLGGGEVTLADCAGRVCIVNVWATWCPQCREEMPVLGEIARSRRDRVLVLGVSVDDDRAVLEGFLRGNPSPYPVVLATEGFLRDYGYMGTLPTTVLVAPDGRIHSRYTGARPREVFERDLRELLGT